METVSPYEPLFYYSGSLSEYAQNVCARFQLIPQQEQPSTPFLTFIDDCLALCVPDTKFKPIVVDFLGGKNLHRQQFGGGKGQLICKAVGVTPKCKPTVLDMTAGLGGDAFALAAVGCSVTMVERNQFSAALLFDGLKRMHEQSTPIDMQLGQFTDSRYLGQHTADVVYLDPMYPDTKNKAAVNKAMTVFHQLVGRDLDAAELLPVARQLATYRVVVKRPKKGEFLANCEPTYQMIGKSSRFDIYVNKSLSAKQ